MKDSYSESDASVADRKARLQATGYSMVTSTEVLQNRVQQWRKRKVLALDTEFLRTNTYYPIVGLVQVFDGRECHLIDPQALSIQPLAEVLEDKEVLKVFHACSEDLEVFQAEVGTIPAPVFDSQVAAAILGEDFSMSYQRLVERYLNVVVPKEQTRSDWLQRPLTTDQLDYAALDVIYLFDVYQLQAERLHEQGRHPWVLEECTSDPAEMPTMIAPDAYFRRIRGAGSLNALQLRRLQRLSAWRENLARECDVPRSRIVDDKSLMSICRDDISDRRLLDKKTKMTHRQIRRYAEEIAEQLRLANEDSESEYPEVIADPTSTLNNRLIRELKELVEDAAKEQRIAPEILATRRHLEQFLRSGKQGDYELPPSLAGWRRSVIGDRLLQHLRSDP